MMLYNGQEHHIQSLLQHHTYILSVKFNTRSIYRQGLTLICGERLVDSMLTSINRPVHPLRLTSFSSSDRSVGRPVYFRPFDPHMD